MLIITRLETNIKIFQISFVRINCYNIFLCSSCCILSIIFSFCISRLSPYVSNFGGKLRHVKSHLLHKQPHLHAAHSVTTNKDLTTELLYTKFHYESTGEVTVMSLFSMLTVRNIQ